MQLPFSKKDASLETPTTPISSESKPTSNSNSWVKDVLETLALAAVLFIIFLFVIKPNVVHGISMEPNFHDGEYLLTNRISHWMEDYHRGDVVIAQSPIQDELLIKRIIGLPGEQIELTNGHVVIFNNQHPEGQTLKESYIASSVKTTGNQFLADDTKYTIPAHNYFIMGDNRPNSGDSRLFGPVDQSQLLGTAAILYWPPPKIGIIHRPTY